MQNTPLNSLVDAALQAQQPVTDSYELDAPAPQVGFQPQVVQESPVARNANGAFGVTAAASEQGAPVALIGTATTLTPIDVNAPAIVRHPAFQPAGMAQVLQTGVSANQGLGLAVDPAPHSLSGAATHQDAPTEPFQLKTEEYTFEVRADGLYCCPLDKQEAPFKRICGSFILTKLIDERKTHWGFLISIGISQILLPLAMVNHGGKKLAEALGSNGFALSGAHSSMTMLRAYLLANHQNIPIQFVVERPGWVVLDDGKWYYAHPSLILPESPLVVNNNVLEMSNVNFTLGTLQDWQQTIGQDCIGNFNFVFAICAVLAGILLKFFGLPSIILNFFGLSSKGKTTLLRVANSVFTWDDDGGVKTWRGTDNGYEAELKRHNDGALVLDEMFQCDISMLDKIIYMIANGKPKKRFNDKAADNTPWHLTVLSSGELSGKAVQEKGGRHYHGGMEARCLDIPIEAEGGYGAFHRLPPNMSGADFARHLNEMASRSHGSVMQAIVGHLVQELHTAIDNITVIRNSFIQESVYSINDEIEGRVFQHFALIAAIGEYAIQLQILPWPQGHAVEAVRYIFSVWQHHRRENTLSIDDQIINCLMNAIQREGQSGFHLLSGGSAVGNLGNAYGYRKEYPTHLELILLTDGFERLFGKWNRHDVCRVLAARGYLVRDGKNFSTKRAIPGNRAARCFVLRVQHTL